MMTPQQPRTPTMWLPADYMENSQSLTFPKQLTLPDMANGNPWDHSSILLSNRAGANWGRGIEAAAQEFGDGIKAYYKRKEEKRLEGEFLKYIKPRAKELGIAMTGDDAEDDKVLLAGYRSVGPQGVMAFQQHLQSQKRAEQEQANQGEMMTIRRQAMENERAKLEAEALGQRREQMARQRAFGPVSEAVPIEQQIMGGAGFRQLDPAAKRSRAPSPEEMMFGYVQAGGSDTGLIKEMMGQVATAKKPAKQIYPEGPRLSTDGRYQRSGPDEKWEQVAEKKNDEKALTAAELQQINALQQSARDLTTLEQAFADIKDPNFGGPVAGRVRSLDPTNVNIQRLDSLVTAATPNLARGVFREVGVLTDEDIKRYRALLPNRNDTADQRAQKLKDLRARLTSSAQETLGTLKAAGRDVGGLEDRLLGRADSPPHNSAPKGDLFTDTDGTQYSIITLRGQRGIKKGGKFYPVVE